ncbi:MAG: N-acetyl-gamma-glutamyl-phosphate reductase [Clostridiales bacterium]|nr:N-acetyl-gamma-glutamyl-phosphate reductase [Clostridiales bacterium]
MYKIFIDGSEGAVGLNLADRLYGRAEIELIKIAPELRKDSDERAKLSNNADVVFLCLPDKETKKAVSRVTNERTRVIDASTAHRVADGWTYGLPELSPERFQAIKNARRLANPGCYAAGFLIAVYPLVESGLVAADYPFTCFGLSGYSGAGRRVIECYESADKPARYARPRFYALGQNHKHLPEMREIAKLDSPPIFNPIICDFYEGMTVTVPLRLNLFKKKMSAAELHDFYARRYDGRGAVKVERFGAHEDFEDGTLDAMQSAFSDTMRLYVSGDADRAAVIASYDNLGKGASGNAVQCMNIMLGLDPLQGLR